MATTRAAPKLSADGDASGITAAPGRLVEAEAAFQAALDKATEATRLVTVEAAKTTPVELDPAAKSVLASVRLRATDQARAFKPAAEDRKPHVEMGKYVDALAALSERRLTAISARLTAALFRRDAAQTAIADINRLFRNSFRAGQHEAIGRIR